ncbi:hypothetical protein BDV93DRAFT_513075 [Ceratobasidium sp. AG-I]|nr:hypothetical protein BDV93DRAFT_513075 [Ceratobasidium sp. AG-I]
MADIHPPLLPLEQPQDRSVATPGASANNRPRSNPPARDDAVREAPRGGQNAEEPIMIGSSDEEDDPPLAARRTAPARSVAEQRARLHNNRRGTPVPRPADHGLRIMSPPPPLPAHGFHPFGLPPEWPHPLYQIHRRLGTPTLHRLSHDQRLELIRMLSPQRAAFLLGLAPGMEFLGRAEPAPQRPPVEEYDVRMTHASAKPRIGYTYDFALDEEEAAAESNMESKPVAPHVRTRTTIEIHDSPPLAPVDRKGKGRARTVDLDPDVIDISEDPSPYESSWMSPGSSSSETKLTKRNREGAKREVVEILSDDESDGESRHASGSGADSASPSQSVQQETMQTVLVCASCRRPLRTGGDKLWALRCGHMIDSRCYRKFAERPIAREDIPVLGESSSDAPPAKRQRSGRHASGRGKGKGKGKAPEPSSTPQVTETHEWECPVAHCKRPHWTERVVTAGVGAWQPMKDTGAIKVFV